MPIRVTGIVDGMSMDSDYEILTYKAISERLGIKLTSARQTASRRGWRKIKQNDGTVKVEVPLRYLHRKIVDASVNEDINIDVDHTVEIAKLAAENLYLKQRIADLEKDRDGWKEYATLPWWRRALK